MHDEFDSKFERLMGFPPFEWQKRLYHDYFAKGDVPYALDIPTGLGKTSVISLWYLAWKAAAAVPRRLVYIVDRRVVVDQATEVAEEISKKSQDPALRISTLRGRHVDNREWLADPAAPTIVVGTVDMIGSRLLFSGYGVSRKMRPYHAGLLGADTLVVLDEAHLVPPFEKLLETIGNEAEIFGPKAQRDRGIVPPFKLLSLSATGRNNGVGKQRVFFLLPEDRKDEVVRERLEAHKQLTIKVLDDASKQLLLKLIERAWSLGNEPSARVLVYCDRRKDAEWVKVEIDKKLKRGKCGDASKLLVGGQRVFEREELADWLKSHGFIGNVNGPPQQPTFLIATSAGEVGIDLDADHMVCDLVEWERMVQRLGRVNRRGRGKAQVEVIAAPRNKRLDKGAKIECLTKPLEALSPIRSREVDSNGQLHLPFATDDTSISAEVGDNSLQISDYGQPRDASPGAILELRDRAAQNQDLKEVISAATTPAPLRPALTRALVDAWSLTSLAEHTGRPDDIQPWLRGWEEDQQPQTIVIWRKHLPVRKDGIEARTKEIEAFFEAAPPHASEILETETYKVVDWIVKRAEKAIGDASLLKDEIIAYASSSARDWRDPIRGHDLKKSLKELKKELAGMTLVVDARLGGLSNDGMLNDKENGQPRVADDGDGEWLPAQKDGEPVIRFRVRSTADEESLEPDGDWRERYRFATEQSNEGEGQRFLVIEKWRHDAETEDDRSIGRLQELAEHHAWTACKARALADAIPLPNEYAEMLAIAARLHDEGKRHLRWQRAAKAPSNGKIYAKTDKRMNANLLDGYRHEFGSLPYADEDNDFNALPHHLRELALHLIAAHHGWARPVISTGGSDGAPSALEERARDVALLFAKLQKRWGPWGLAWWEALLRAADQQASRANDAGENVR